MLTLKQYYIAQMLKGTNAAFPAKESGEEIFSNYWGDYTGARIVATVEKILEITGDDGDEPIDFDG